MDNYIKKSYILTSLDPVHIGTGGYRMDRVDNSIIRDMDGIPKIPGSSLSGAVRSYAALKLDSKCGGNNVCTNINKLCRICETFGYTSTEKSRKGVVNFYDARIMLFPIATMIGPVWVTTVANCVDLLNLDVEIAGIDFEKDQFLPLTEKSEMGKRINLGWIMLTVKDNLRENQGVKSIADKLKGNDLTKDLVSRTVLVHPTIFTQVVNDHLEVRTSVSINPLTGAAEEGALFTYEAIPRSTVFMFDMVLTNPKFYDSKVDLNQVSDTVEKGMALLEALGVGGMTTRGFGRLRFSEYKKVGESK